LKLLSALPQPAPTESPDLGSKMPRNTKPKVGRPKLPKGEAKGQIVPVRFNASDLKRIESAARASHKTISEWIRGTIASAMEAQ
jgi:hypothetical protein